MPAAMHYSNHVDVNIASPTTSVHVHVSQGSGCLLTRVPHGCMLQVLLQYGADIDQRDAAGRTPLLVAVAAGHADVAKHLLAKGVRACIHVTYVFYVLWFS